MTVGPTAASTVKIQVFMGEIDEPAESVDLPIPSAPEVFPGGGGWKWVGPLPNETVDLGNGYSLKLNLIKTRKANGGDPPGFRSPGKDPASGEVEEGQDEDEPDPHPVTDTQMIETNINLVLGKGLSYAKAHQATGADYDDIKEWVRVARRFLGLPLPKAGMTLAMKRVERETWERTSPKIRKGMAEGLVNREAGRTESLPT